MDEPMALKAYGPYVQRAAAWFMSARLRSRISYEDLLQEGYLTLLLLSQDGQADNPHFVHTAVCHRMLSIIRDNCSALHVSCYGQAALRSDSPQLTKVRDSATIALKHVVPIHEIDDHANSDALCCWHDDSTLLVKEFMESLNERELTVCTGLLDGESQREISRNSGIPLITVRRICQRLKDRLTCYLEDSA